MHFTTDGTVQFLDPFSFRQPCCDRRRWDRYLSSLSSLSWLISSPTRSLDNSNSLVNKKPLIVNAQTLGRVDFFGLLTAYKVYQLNKASINGPCLFLSFYFIEYSWFTMLLVSAVQQNDSVIHILNHILLNKRIYTYIFFFIYNSLGYPVGPCCLSILCT